MNHKNLDDYFEKKISDGRDIGWFVGATLATFASGAAYWYYGKELGGTINDFLALLANMPGGA